MDDYGSIVISTPMIRVAGSNSLPEPNTISLSNHFVCFIDLLGVKKNIDNMDGLEKIYRALRIYKKIKSSYSEDPFIGVRIVSDDNKLLSQMEINLPYQCSFFSDSLIISYKHEKPRPDYAELYCILYDINMLVFVLLMNGIFVRGGLSYGKLYHDGDICFGQALVEAVYLESNIAIYPRVVISPNIFDDTSDAHPFKTIKTNNKTLQHLHNYAIATDKTGTEPIIWGDYLDHLLLNPAQASIIGKNIINELNQPHPERVMKKYLWMKEYFNGQLSRTDALHKEARVLEIVN